MYVKPSEHIQQQLFWYGYYEKEASITWQTLVNPESIILDIGANAGYYTLLVAREAYSVYAFEPSANMQQAFADNIALNHIKNAVLQRMAAGDKNDKVKLFLAAPENTGMSGLVAPENFQGNTEEVNMVKIDDWVIKQSLKRVDAVKIDVEGAEMKVLTGMQQVLERHRPYIFIEVVESLLNKLGSGMHDVYSFFETLNYKPYEIVKANELRAIVKPMPGDLIVFWPAERSFPKGISVLEQT